MRVSEVALGCSSFGSAWGRTMDRGTIEQVFGAFVAAGGNFVDTADTYQDGESETTLAELIRADRDDLVVASKFSLGVHPDDTLHRTGNSRKVLLRSLDRSLSRLQTDRIDLYWVHVPDLITPVDEIMRTLDDAVRQGKILHVGFSNFPAWMVSRACTIAEFRGWTRPVAIQVEYSLAERAAERELIPMANAMGMSVVAWAPLRGGLLARGSSDDGCVVSSGMNAAADTSSGRPVAGILELLRRISIETHSSAAQVAIAWLRRKPSSGYDSCIPILGARTLAQVSDSLKAVEMSLSDKHLTALDEVSRLDAGYPHDLVMELQQAVFGSRREQMELPRSSRG